MGAYLGASVYNDSQVTEEWVREQIEKNVKGVFFVEIGSTSYADTLAAYNAGKMLIAKQSINTTSGVDTNYYQLLLFDTDSDEGDYFTFGRVLNGNTFTYWNLHVNGGWGNKTMSPVVTIDSQLYPNSHNPVANSAIYAVIGNVESLLAAL